MKWLLLLLAGLTVNSAGRLHAQAGKTAGIVSKYSAYLFVYFTGNQKKEEAIRFALSNDGYHFRALNNNEPVIASEQISSTGGVRDPHILRGAEGKTFYMVATDMVSANGWNSNRAMVLLQSKDLIHWTSAIVNIPGRFKQFRNVNRVWAPQTIYDPTTKKYMIYWSMRAGNDPDVIYYAYANKDFTGLETEPKQLFFNPGGTPCIDGDIVFKNGQYYLFFKTEGNGNGIKIAVSDKLTGGYQLRDAYVQQTKDPVEGAGTFALNDGSGYILMYDVYTKGRYQFTKTTDLRNFKVVDNAVSMNFHPRHGTVMPVTREEAARLVRQWYTPESVMTSAQSALIKKNNIVLDTAARKLYLPVLPGTPLRNFDPQFIKFPGVTIVPARGGFSKGPVSYTVTVNGHNPETFTATVLQDHNPVLNGYYADPEILYSKKRIDFISIPPAMGLTTGRETISKYFHRPILWDGRMKG